MCEILSKTVYLFNDDGEFTGTYEAQACPIEEGQFIVPTQSTSIEPPEATDGFQIKWNGKEWESVAFTEEQEAIIAADEKRNAWDYYNQVRAEELSKGVMYKGLVYSCFDTFRATLANYIVLGTKQTKLRSVGNATTDFTLKEIKELAVLIQQRVDEIYQASWVEKDKIV